MFTLNVYSTDGSDYTATSGFSAIVTFNNAQRRSCVDILITDDNEDESEERFSLQLADLGGSFALPDNFFLSPNISEIIIQDNDSETLQGLSSFYCMYIAAI